MILLNKIPLKYITITQKKIFLLKKIKMKLNITLILEKLIMKKMKKKVKLKLIKIMTIYYNIIFA